MQSVLSAVGRVMIATIFLLSAVGNKIPNFDGVSQYMAAEGVPQPKLMLAGAIAFLIIGASSVVLGYKIKYGASLLLIFLILATYFFHDFWNFEGQEQQMQMIQFMKNLALMGVMVYFIANGPGHGSFDQTTLSSRENEPTASLP